MRFAHANNDLSECQNGNWASHKSMCKTLHLLETAEAFRTTVKNLRAGPYEDLRALNAKLESDFSRLLEYLVKSLKRDLTLAERNLVGWEPLCMACGRTERILRVEAATHNGTSASSPVSLKACDTCKMAFYCSQEHWDAVQHKHAEEACEDGHDGLSQCRMNQELLQDVMFVNLMARASSMEFSWAPERVVQSWKSLKDTDWITDYSSKILEDFGIPAELADPFVRAASVGLSMPMTILWGLENLNTDDQWTRKETLTIHVLGASNVEISYARIFEEILHRLPEVQNLQLVLIGPELSKIVATEEISTKFDMETCPTCATRHRKRMHHLYAQTYHEYARGNDFTKPDLAIAFNSGSSQEHGSSWEETMSVLVKNKTPTVFTAYNQEEAEDEAKLLREAGASLVPGLGPVKNVWGSIAYRKEPNKVTGFYAVNGWLAGGFR
ncbi:hypothetical protein DXG01_012213 [Tephrocybe rancida]|nr:hypothetical protein DXG01_012213 [Tephrocybe rancida]